MAVGWAQDGAVQDQIDATVDSAVKRARSRLAQGESLLTCEECGEPIADGLHAIGSSRRLLGSS
jgi:RNA polymerase-binding transcription factor DksA